MGDRVTSGGETMRNGEPTHKPMRRYSKMREMADGKGYVSLIETPFGRVRLRVLRVGRFPVGPDAREVRKQRVARSRMMHALAWVNRQAQLRKVTEALDQASAQGEIAKIGPDEYISWLAADTGYPETKRKRATIFALWRDGATIAEIAAALDTTPGTIGVEMSRMRLLGWSLPRRGHWDDDTLAAQRHVWRLRGLPKPPAKPKRPRSSRGFCRAKNGRWRAYAYREGRQIHLGTYETERDAAQAVAASKETT